MGRKCRQLEKGARELSAKLLVALGDPLEKALDARGIGPGAHIVVLPQGLLAKLPIWLASNPVTGETLAERYVITLSPNFETLTARSKVFSPNTRTVAFFNENAKPISPLAKAGRFLFERMVPGATFLQRPQSPEEVVAQLKGAQVWQFWTHADFDEQDVMESGLQLSLSPYSVRKRSVNSAPTFSISP